MGRRKSFSRAFIVGLGVLSYCALVVSLYGHPEAQLGGLAGGASEPTVLQSISEGCGGGGGGSVAVDEHSVRRQLERNRRQFEVLERKRESGKRSASP